MGHIITSKYSVIIPFIFSILKVFRMAYGDSGTSGEWIMRAGILFLGNISSLDCPCFRWLFL